jgi:hypothetical protein
MAVEWVAERKNQRYFVHKHVNYQYDLESGYIDDRMFQGITIDSSALGMGLYIYHPLTVGDRLKVSNDMYSEPRQFATVKWISKIDDDVYRAGLMFIPE